jgi:ERCC4-type nuclease
MSIVLDTREHGLHALLPEVPCKQLPVGDIWIQQGDALLLVIERKTTADFEASFLDGRYREQRTRLLAFCAEKKAKALYLLEGGLDGSRRKLERSALQKLIHRLMLRYGVATWSTRTLEDTANTVKLLAQQITEDPKVFEGEQLSYTDVQHVTKKANKDDPKAFALGALQGCPGVSAKAASAVWDALGESFEGIMLAEEGTFAQIKVGERKLGPTVGKRLYALLHSKKDSTVT